MGAFLRFHKQTLALVSLTGLILMLLGWNSKDYAPLLLGLLLLNTYAFFLAWKDKRAAKRNSYRIPEANLWTIAILGGAVGLFAAMLLFRHKTKHLSFRLGVPAVLGLQAVLLFLLAQ